MERIIKLIVIGILITMGHVIVDKSESSAKNWVRALMKVLMTIGVIICIIVALLCIWATLGYAKDGDIVVAIQLSIVTVSYTISVSYMVYKYIKRIFYKNIY